MHLLTCRLVLSLLMHQGLENARPVKQHSNWSMYKQLVGTLLPSVQTLAFLKHRTWTKQTQALRTKSRRKLHRLQYFKFLPFFPMVCAQPSGFFSSWNACNTAGGTNSYIWAAPKTGGRAHETVFIPLVLHSMIRLWERSSPSFRVLKTFQRILDPLPVKHWLDSNNLVALQHCLCE